jgi:biotin carboxylase
VIDGNAEAPARDCGSRFMNVNFFDSAAVEEALRAVPLVGVMPLNDFGVRTASQLTEARGLPGYSREAALAVTSKVEMKRRWQQAGLPTARFCWARKDDIIAGRYPEWSTFPCVVKPSFAGGASRGVGLVGSWEEARDAVIAAEHRYLDDEVVLEAFIDGSEHTIEALVIAGRTQVLSVSDKQNYAGSMSIVQNLYFPGPVGNRHRKTLEGLVQDAVTALGIAYGTTHFEVLISGGQPYLLEVGGRPGGGINFDPICRISTGHDYPSLLAAVLTGQPPDFSRGETAHLAWHYFDAGVGELEHIEGFAGLCDEPDVVAADLYEQVGKPRLDLRDDLARPGFVLVRADSHEHAKQRASELCARVRFCTRTC